MSRAYPIQFGEHGTYELSEKAMRHILAGDTTVRPINESGVRSSVVVLSGGLHTWEGWEEFSKQHPRVVHLLGYDVDRHDDWFYARELQNGVITLKIPRKMFTGDAASITMMPDSHYKSGYLWKTLYPVGYSEDDIIQVLTEAFDNLDREDSSHPTKEQPAGVLFGYALIDTPLKSLKVRIQVRGNQIQSAFPAWEQPATGNNGKPYSHAHSINFNIAASTIFHERYAEAWGPVFPDNCFSLQELMKLTPAFILNRPRRDTVVCIDEWRDIRERSLIAIASSITPEQLQHVETYLGDFVCCKNPYGAQAGIYRHFIEEIRCNDAVFNAAQICENVAECIQVLTHCDLEHGTRRAMDAMVRFLRMAIVHTGGLSSLMFKRVLSEFVEAALGHHEKNSVNELLAGLATSPCRAALYTEFNLNPFVKRNDEFGLLTVGVPEVDIELGPEHLYEFIALNLGENYLQLFSADQRLALAKGCFRRPEEQEMVAHVMSFLSGIDFQFFMPDRLNLAWLGDKNPPAEDDLISIARDYSRMLVLYRQRIVMEDPQAYGADLDYGQSGTDEFFNLIRQKHKRQFVITMHRAMLNQLIGYAGSVGYLKLNAKVENTLERLSKEAVPMPKPIPDYILEGRDIPESFAGNTEDLVREIMGGGSNDLV
jgi:hypothetical protein